MTSGRISPRHSRKNSLSHHKGQEQEVHGGRTAAKQQGTTDSTRGRGRARSPEDLSPWAAEVLSQHNYGLNLERGTNPDTIAQRLDPRKAEPLPPDHPEVLKEIKFDRMSRLMQPGSNDEVDQQLGLDENDDWIS